MDVELDIWSLASLGHYHYGAENALNGVLEFTFDVDYHLMVGR